MTIRWGGHSRDPCDTARSDYLPAPTPVQHGHHQLAARLAGVDAFYSAALIQTSSRRQIEDEGLAAFGGRSNIFQAAHPGEEHTGPDCAGAYAP